MLRAWRVSSSFSEAQSAGVQVLELGKYEEEAGEVRVMDMAVLPLVGVDLQADEKVVVIGGYSDGKLRVSLTCPCLCPSMIPASDSNCRSGSSRPPPVSCSSHRLQSLASAYSR